MLLKLVFLAANLQVALGSVCVVSFWTEWGPCIGNCQFALTVRNRHVIRPPFPERTSDGRLAIRPCPPLYQVQTCVPEPCIGPSTVQTLSGNSVLVNEDSDPSSPPTNSSFQTFPDLPEQTEEAVQQLPVVQDPLVSDSSFDARIENERQLPDIDYADIKDHLPFTKTDTTRTETTATTKREPVQTEQVTSDTSQQTTTQVDVTENSVTTTTTTTTEENTPTETVADTQSSTLPHQTTTVETDKTTKTEAEALEVIASEPSIIEKESFFALQSTTGELSETTTQESNETSNSSESNSQVLSATLLKEENSESRSGEIEGSGESAEIPIINSKEIVQRVEGTTSTDAPTTTSTDNLAPDPDDFREVRRDFGDRPTSPCGSTLNENKSCCRKRMRFFCPDGRTPQMVMRYYRNVDNPECVSYSYAYCGLELELEEMPIKFEEDCYSLCYSKLEKEALDLFKEAQFRDGFRTDTRV